LGWHPLAVVQYTFTHKQYTEQYNDREYPEWNTINIRMHQHYNQCTYCTKLGRSIQNTHPYVKWYKIEKTYMKNVIKGSSI